MKKLYYKAIFIFKLIVCVCQNTYNSQSEKLSSASVSKSTNLPTPGFVFVVGVIIVSAWVKSDNPQLFKHSAYC